MAGLAILTPTYRPDLEAALLLHRSVLRHTQPAVVHHLVVPGADLALFRRHQTSRLRVHCAADFLPRSFVSIYLTPLRLRQNALLARALKVQAVNLRHPWPPLRGWILQLIVKIAVAAELDAEVVVVADSDVALVQHVDVDTFRRGGVVRFYRAPGGVDESMHQHRRWHHSAERLLGLAARTDEAGGVDYIAPFLAWDPELVRGIQRAVHDVSGTDWRSRIGQERAFSECILYGRYVDELAPPGARSWTSDDDLCQTYWDTRPLGGVALTNLLAGLTGDTLALHIQSTSATAVSVRESAISEAERRVHARS